MKYGLFILFLICAISNTYASTDCLQRPSCEELGYDHSVEECAGRDILPCPFDIKNTETVYCGDTFCDRLVAEQGFVKVKKKMTANQVASLFKNNAKLCLAENISVNIGCYNHNILVNGGGGHTWTTTGLFCYGENITFEDIKIKNSSPNAYYMPALSFKGKNATVRNVEITQTTGLGDVHGLVISNGGTIENVTINITAKDAEEINAITTSQKSTASNITVNAAGGEQTLISALTTSKDLTANQITLNASSGQKAYTVVGNVQGIETEPVGGTFQRPAALYDGQNNTKLITEQIGKNALAAYAATQFYVGDKDGDFGQGKWYLPAIGEWMDFYGIDISQMTSAYANSGVTGSSKKLINETLSALAEKGAEAEILKGNKYYQSSSEFSTAYIWSIDPANGYRNPASKYYTNQLVRAALRLDNLSVDSAQTPQIGDVVYTDKSFGSAADYDGSKIPAGVVAAISSDNKIVTILNLKELTFSSTDRTGNFDAEAPYSGSLNITSWAHPNHRNTDITEIENYANIKMITTLNPTVRVVRTDIKP